jgi:hypothetical protein
VVACTPGAAGRNNPRDSSRYCRVAPSAAVSVAAEVAVAVVAVAMVRHNPSVGHGISAMEARSHMDAEPARTTENAAGAAVVQVVVECTAAVAAVLEPTFAR